MEIVLDKKEVFLSIDIRSVWRDLDWSSSRGRIRPMEWRCGSKWLAYYPSYIEDMTGVYFLASPHLSLSIQF